MELTIAKDEEDLIINSDKESPIINNIDKNNIDGIIITKKLRKCKDIPYLVYLIIIGILTVIISIIIYIVFNSKYGITYVFEEEAYDKSQYSDHNYSSITFTNGLKLVLVKLDSLDEAGASITFDYGYLDNKYEPGSIKLAFLSLISDNMTKSDSYINYFGAFHWIVEKFYTSFYFQILTGGFQQYLKCFSKLTYLEKNDNRNDKLNNTDLTPIDNLEERKSHLLEYLVYGYNNNSEDILPQGDNSTRVSISNESINNIIKMVFRDPSKIKIVLYSHYKMSIMKKYFLKYFTDIINYIIIKIRLSNQFI